MRGTFAETVEDSHRVTSLELFFDLVFVFALTQVTGYLSHHLDPVGFLEGLVLLALMYWAWVAYAWLGTTIRLDEGTVRVLLFAAMAAILVVALGLPEAFSDLPGGFDPPWSAATVIVVAYAAVRILHLALYALASRGDPDLGRAVLRFAAPVAASLGLLILGSFLAPMPRLACYAGAVLLDYGGAVIGGGRGWRVSTGHFAERHGLIIIIALGESIVSIGVGVAELPLSPAIVVAACVGFVVAACLWWVYFDVTAVAAEHRLGQLSGDEQSRAARDAYSFGHLFLVAGIVLVALGLKKVLVDVGEAGLPGEHLKPLVAAALCLGAAQYLLAHVYFRWRMTRTWAVPRMLAALALAALVPVALRVPALWALIPVAGVLLVLVAHETATLGRVGHQLRHQGH